MTTEAEQPWRLLWRRILLLGLALIISITGFGALIGGLAAGMPGVLGALIGGAVTTVFVGVSATIMYVGRSWQLNTLAMALGLGFLMKVGVFMVVLPRLAQSEALHGMTAFITIVASVIGSTMLEAVMFHRARIPYVDPEAR